MALGASHRLQDGIEAVETMTRFALATLALASGVYTYLGVRSILDGSATAVFFAALVYSCAVSVAIYAFWTYMARFYPHIIGTAARTAMLGIMALGCLMIIAMASWLNAAALAGSAALEQHLAETVEDYTADLDRAHQNALAAQSLLPDIQRASERFQRLSDQERESGALTGTTGAGSVVQLLGQMAAQLNELETGITASRERVTTLFDEGRAHLATMRGLVSAPGAIDPRADQFAAEAVALTGTITALEQTSIAASVKRAAEDLSLGAIAIDLLPAVLVFMLSIAHGALRRQEQSLPFAERITAAELLEALEVQKALQRSGYDIQTAISEAEAREQSNITNLDLSGKGPRK
jgi:hypothetical protein